MQKLIVILLLLTISIANAQEWHVDFTEAKKQATEKNQKIILVFQGSDWCTPCMKLENEIWSSQEFKAYASENLTLLKADFPRRRKNKLSKEQQKKNNTLAEKYNDKGLFPLVVVLDNTGKLLGKTGYKKTNPEEYIKILTSF